MTLDIRGSLKTTKLSTNTYVVFEELISNAIDSHLIRKHNNQKTPPLKIDITVELIKNNITEDLEDVYVSCKDNGCGLGEDQLEAFLTKDTSYKDDLQIPGIGSCLGAGRIQFFHHFSRIDIKSTFLHEDSFIERNMQYIEPKKHITREDFHNTPGLPENIGTTISLRCLREPIKTRIRQIGTFDKIFSASELKKQMLLSFLQRLISLGEQVGDFEIKFTTQQPSPTQAEETTIQLTSLKRSDLPKITAKEVVQIEEQDPVTGNGIGAHQKLSLFHYKLDSQQFDVPRNAIAFCAKSTPVKDITSRYLRTRAEQTNPVNGFNHFVFIEGPHLDNRVNEQRDDFDHIPQEIPTDDLFSNERISYGSIYDAIDPVIGKMVAPSDWSKEQIIKDATEQFGVNEAMLQDTSTRIRYGESAEAVTQRVLKKYQDRIIDETAAIFSLKQELKDIQPDTEDFREKVNELAWKYTSSLRNFDMATLSQLIVRRAAIVEVLSLACNKSLAIQTTPTNERRKDEKIIHSVFFPMRKDSTEVTDHDMWLLSEEYHYYEHIASDTPLASITWGNNEKVFESDIDEELQKLLSKRSHDNGAKRPDIALFSKEGSATIIEFKAPGVSLDEHIGDLSEYAYLLGAKSGGKIKRFYGYLIGDTINPLRLNGWTSFPVGKGWFHSSPLIDPYTQRPLGETYFEILYFDDVISRAKKRIGIYKDKLKLNFQ